MGRQSKILKDFYMEFHLKDKNHTHVKDDFKRQIVQGNQGNKEACSMMMLPSFISKLPKGNEVGDYFAVDIGGTNMRVLQVIVNGKPTERVHSFQKVELPYQVYTGSNDGFYNWVATQFIDFTQQQGLKKDYPYVIGFCFSFPTELQSHRDARLIEWTKEFKIEGGTDKNVGQYLTDALKKQGLKYVDVACVINDTVATFAASRYYYPNLEIGLVMGTGTNACYQERIKAITKIQDFQQFKDAQQDDQMLMNMEWAYFKSQYLPSSQQDKEIDRASDSPGASTFEKMIASKYLGSLTRKVFLRMIDIRTENRSVEYPSYLYENIKNNTSLDAIMVTRVVSYYPGGSRQLCIQILKDLLKISDSNIDKDLIEDLHRACLWTVERSAELLGTIMSGLVEHVAEYKQANSYIDIIIDGSMYEKVAMYQRTCLKYFHKYLKLDPQKNFKVQVKVSTELPSMGSALLACQYKVPPQDIK